MICHRQHSQQGITKCGIILPMTFALRSYQPSDLRALYEICLKTGDSGNDATTLYRDPDLLGHFYAAPYGVLVPDTCFVIADASDTAVGYIMCAPDTAAFGQLCEHAWFPVLRAHYPMPAPEDQSPDASMIRAIHAGQDQTNAYPDYPAHLHIDILPIAQGQGWGRRLMQALFDRLRALHISGVHLGVGAKNANAIAFYERVGFHRLATFDWGILFGMRM
jgi:ribosomal protein S18 acetylase RimI-like enzyme